MVELRSSLSCGDRRLITCNGLFTVHGTGTGTKEQDKEQWVLI